MPYCPKCDMEFVDGITSCSDCGGPLMDAQEAAELQKAEKLKREEEAFYEADSRSDNSSEKSDSSKAETRAYITKRQRYEDTHSSVSAFSLLGGIFTAFGVLCFINIIELPLDPGPMMLFQTVLTVMGIGCLIVALVSKKSTDRLIKEADVEDARTKELVDWFTQNHTASGMDDILFKEDASLEENDLYLKRFELIQDRLVTGQDLPDQSYVDYLCEEIYKRIFEN